MFPTVLFTVAGSQKQPECPSTDEWIKMWCVCMYVCMYVCVCVYVYIYTHTHTQDYYSAIKRNKIVPSAEMWADGPRDCHTE